MSKASKSSIARLPNLSKLYDAQIASGVHQAKISEPDKTSGVEWSLLTPPDPHGRALVIGGGNPVSLVILDGMFKDVCVWSLNEESTDKYAAVIARTGLRINCQYVPPCEIVQELQRWKCKFSLIAFDHSLFGSPWKSRLDYEQVLEAAVSALTEYGQCCILTANWQHIGKPRELISQIVGKPTIAGVRNFLLKIGLHQVSTFYPYPTFEHASAILNWPNSRSIVQRSFLVRLMGKIGLDEYTHRAIIILAGRFERKSLLQRIADTAAKDYSPKSIRLTQCLVRPNGTLVVFLELDEQGAVLRIPLNSAALDRLRHSWSTHSSVADHHPWIQILLPDQLADGVAYGLPFYVEQMCIGKPARDFIDHSENYRDIQRFVKKFLVRLILAGSYSQIDEQSFNRIVDVYIAPITRYAQDLTKPLAILSRGLRDTMFDKNLLIGPVHGDFNPSNVFVSQRTNQITGVIDWDTYEDRGLPLIDLIHFLFGNKHRHYKSLGKRVVAAMKGGIFSEYEMSLIQSYMKELSIEENMLQPIIILYWLRHISLQLKHHNGQLNDSWVAENLLCPLTQMQTHSWV